MAAPGVPGIPAVPPVQGKAEMALDAARVYAEEEAKRKRLECRFYEAQYPEIEEVVMVNVRNIAEMGAYVVLLEYNDIEGMILLSELSRRRIRSINKLIRVNRNEVAMVLRVDKEKVCVRGDRLLFDANRARMWTVLPSISERMQSSLSTAGFAFLDLMFARGRFHSNLCVVNIIYCAVQSQAALKLLGRQQDPLTESPAHTGLNDCGPKRSIWSSRC